MPADLNQMFRLDRLRDLQPALDREEITAHLTLGEMIEMMEEVHSGLLAGLGREGVIELNDIQWLLLKRIVRRGVLPPWEHDLRQTAYILRDIGYLDLSPVPSDSIRRGGDFLRCILTRRGTLALTEGAPD